MPAFRQNQQQTECYIMFASLFALKFCFLMPAAPAPSWVLFTSSSACLASLPCFSRLILSLCVFFAWLSLIHSVFLGFVDVVDSFRTLAARAPCVAAKPPSDCLRCLFCIPDYLVLQLGVRAGLNFSSVAKRIRSSCLSPLSGHYG